MRIKVGEEGSLDCIVILDGTQVKYPVEADEEAGTVSLYDIESGLVPFDAVPVMKSGKVAIVFPPEAAWYRDGETLKHKGRLLPEDVDLSKCSLPQIEELRTMLDTSMLTLDQVTPETFRDRLDTELVRRGVRDA